MVNPRRTPQAIARPRKIDAVGPKETLARLSRELGPTLYFIRTKDDLIKIGYTGDIATRKRFYGSGWQHILALVPGTIGDEAELHKRFAPHLARGQEYYHAVPELISYINEIRMTLNVSAI